MSACILIGTSAGGVSALQKLFAQLPADFLQPLVVIQHLPADSRVQMDLVYRPHLPFPCVGIEDKMPMAPGHAYFAPPNYHLLFELDGRFSLSQEEPVHYSRPSIDVAFESAALAFGPRVCGVLLTGANEDGAQGLWDIHLKGGVTLVQNPNEAEVPVMPLAALKLFTPTAVLGLAQIARRLSSGNGEGDH